MYVQDNLMLAAKDLYAIMKGTVGANEGRIYVCGDAKGMARDVHRALHRILMTEGVCWPRSRRNREETF